MRATSGWDRSRCFVAASKKTPRPCWPHCGSLTSISETIGHVVEYAGLRRTEDATNAHYGEMADRAIGLATRGEAAGAFLGPEIAALKDETIAVWLEEVPELELYRQALRRITRQRAHIRSAEVEEVLARAAEVAAASEIAQSVLEDGELPLGEIRDEAGNAVRLAQGNLARYLESGDRRVRQEAWEESADAYLAFRNTFAATLAGAVKRDVFYARARGFGSSLEAALAPDDIPICRLPQPAGHRLEAFPGLASLLQRAPAAARPAGGRPARLRPGSAVGRGTAVSLGAGR